MGAFTFQFWPRGWISRELFIETPLADISKSSILGFEVESEFQSFVCECPNKVLLSEFPHCPIWHDLRHYLENDEFCWAEISFPLGCLIGHKKYRS